MDQIKQGLAPGRLDVLISVRLDAELRAVRAQEPRADAKATSLLTLCSGLLVAGLALIGSARLTGAAAVFGWAAVALIGVAVALLTAVLRPNLRSDFGFVRWSRISSGREVIKALAAEPESVGEAGSVAEQGYQLHWLSASLYRKFARIRLAQALLIAALAAAVIGAALTAVAR